jgi:hypothetical protein
MRCLTRRAVYDVDARKLYATAQRQIVADLPMVHCCSAQDARRCAPVNGFQWVPDQFRVSVICGRAAAEARQDGL